MPSLSLTLSRSQLSSVSSTGSPSLLLSCLSLLTALPHCSPSLCLPLPSPLSLSVCVSGPILCIQLSVASLCNFSLSEVFHDQLTSIALGPLLSAISAPHLDAAIKIDCLYFLYNLVTHFPPSHKTAIEENAIAALQKIVKVHSDELILGMVGRILKEICTVETLSRRLLSDGVMAIILKLAKYEQPALKLDLASAVCSLSIPSETSLKMLKLEAVDVLFWLTIHDCMALYDPIRKYVSRALRNFTIQLEDALYLSKEDRLTSVLKVLVKSTNEDVLWQTSVAIYNMLNPPCVTPLVTSEGDTHHSLCLCLWRGSWRRSCLRRREES
jgi:hypothetical protein